MAFKMKGFSGFAKTTNSPMTKTGSDDNISISTDLIKQQQGESTGDFKLRQDHFMNYLQENVGSGRPPQDYMDYATMVNARWDMGDFNADNPFGVDPISAEEKSEISGGGI